MRVVGRGPAQPVTEHVSVEGLRPAHHSCEVGSNDFQGAVLEAECKADETPFDGGTSRDHQNIMEVSLLEDCMNREIHNAL